MLCCVSYYLSHLVAYFSLAFLWSPVVYSKHTLGTVFYLSACVVMLSFVMYCAIIIYLHQKRKHQEKFIDCHSYVRPRL